MRLCCVLMLDPTGLIASASEKCYRGFMLCLSMGVSTCMMKAPMLIHSLVLRFPICLLSERLLRFVFDLSIEAIFREESSDLGPDWWTSLMLAV